MNRQAWLLMRAFAERLQTDLVVDENLPFPIAFVLEHVRPTRDEFWLTI
jgi:hypothetical protein